MEMRQVRKDPPVSMYHRAMAWAEKGWLVIPVNATTKRPLIEGWQNAASLNPEQIRDWWAFEPTAMPGIVPGLSGCFVLDVDVKGDKKGMESLAAIEAATGFEAWEVPQQTTRSGGLHLFFKGYGRTTGGTLGDGLDTRGGNHDGSLGYVVAWSEEPPCAAVDAFPAPEALTKRLATQNVRDDEPQVAKVELDLDANVQRAIAYLVGTPTPGDGERNISLFKTVCTLKDLGVSLLKSFDLIESHPHVAGGLIEENIEEFNTTVRSAYRNGQLQPGVQAINMEARDAAAAGYSVTPTSEAGDISDGGDESVSRSSKGTGRFAVWSARRERTPPPWLCRGILGKGQLAGLYGPGGSYKSFVALDLGVAIADQADSWAECPVSATGPVVYISGEGNAEPRLRGIEAHTGRQISDNLAILDGIDLADADDLAGLEQDIRDAMATSWGGQAPVLVIIDTLANATPGQEENSSKEMGLVVKTCKALIRSMGCAVVLVHHTPKSGQGWRGSTAVWNSLDIALELRRTHRNRATLTLARAKDAETGTTWAIKLQTIPTGLVREGEKPEKTLVVASMTPALQADDETPAEEKQDRLNRQLAMSEALTVERRASSALAILNASPPGVEIGLSTFVQQMVTSAGQNANREGISKYIKGVLTREGVNEAHALARYVVSRRPLYFANSEENQRVTNSESLAQKALSEEAE